ncbi:MAG: hypothetical protein RBU21_19050 [FCB group bacterium]|nr:hypothetical protein [FCB group bacterium]
MKTRFVLATLMISLICSIAAAEFRAAIAVRDVTPKELLSISGGMGPSEPAKDFRGKLNVRALAVADADTTTVICSTDFLGFPAALGNRVREKVKNVPPENILIGCTHSHSAPDMYGFPDEDGKVTTNLEYVDFVVSSLADAVNEAVANLKPASVKIATGEAKEGIAYNYYAPKLYDRRCHVMQFLGADGKPFITLVNYASHPEILGPDSGFLSPDFVGPLYDRIAANGGGAGIYMNSAQGGMVTADNRDPKGGDDDIQTWEECIRIGNLLADEALRIVADAPVQENPDLTCLAMRVTFPVENEEMIQVSKISPIGLGIGENNTTSTQMNLVNLGNAQILTIPGEALPNIGFYLKRNMKGEHNFLFGLTNDAFGYIMAKVDFKSFERYNYISRTTLGEMTGEILIEEALKFINESPAPAGAKEKPKDDKSA